MTQRCGRREDLKLSPPLSNHDPRSPARSLGCLISRIFREEEERLFKADTVNEEDPERDRATQV